MDLTTAYSLWFLLPCLLLGAGIAWLMYRSAPRRYGFSKGLSVLLAILRAVVVAVIAFFLLEPMVRSTMREVRKPVVVVAHDGSSSLLAAGDTASLSGEHPTRLQALVDRMSADHEVRTFTFGEQVRDGLHFDQQDGITDMSQLLREVYDRLSGPDLGAVIIASDGIVNRGRDPRAVAERLGVPVHTIALGDTTVRPDLLVKGVDHNRVGYLGNDLPLVVRIEARELMGRRTRLSVMRDGRELVGRDLSVPNDRWFTEVPLMIRADRPGLQRFVVQLTGVEGEEHAGNNSAVIHIDVLDDRRNILLLADAPHPDLGAMRLALGGLEGYSTTLAYMGDVDGDLSGYDLLVTHQLPSVRHGAAELLERARLQRLPVLAILGGNTDIPAFNKSGMGLEVSQQRSTFTDAQAAVDPAFDRFSIGTEERRAIERFPPLQVPFGRYSASKGAIPLAYQRVGMVRTDQPLVLFHAQSERRTATVTGEGFWRWRLSDLRQNGSTEVFDRMLHRMVQYLVLSGDKDRFRVEHAIEFAGNEPILMRAEVYNATFELVNDADVTIDFVDEEGNSYAHSFSRTANAYRLDAGRLPPGRYTYHAVAHGDAGKLEVDGAFSVQELLLERISTVADHGLLADLAASTGGIMVMPGDLSVIGEAVTGPQGVVGRSYTHTTLSDLIGLRWFFALILVLLALEWVLRRRNGAY